MLSIRLNSNVEPKRHVSKCIVSLSTGSRAGEELIDSEGHYRYMGDQRELDCCVPPATKALPAQIVVTPLRHVAWGYELCTYPDAEFTRSVSSVGFGLGLSTTVTVALVPSAICSLLACIHNPFD